MKTLSNKLYNKKEPCPVCGLDNGACRKPKQSFDGNGVLCHGLSYASVGDIFDGCDGRKWKCNKAASGHTATFGLYTGDSKSALADPEKEKARERKAEADRQARLASEMSPGDRHVSYEKL